MRLTTISIILALSLAMLGCAPPNSSRVLDERLEASVEVGEVTTVASATGTSRAWAEIRNKTKRPLQLQARALFYGKRGEPVDINPGWLPIFIPPRSSFTFEAYSLKKATHAVVEVREGN